MFQKYCTTKSKRGNLLLTHGLNLNPDKLLELTVWYQSLGFDVYLLRYSGHRKGEQAHHFSMKDSIQSLQELVHELKGDYYFCGFSLGCLIYAMALANGKIPEAHKNIFLSPAFKPTLLIKLSGFMPKNFWIPSRIYKDYQFHKGLPAAVYQDVFQHSSSISELPFKNKTLVMMDKGDLALKVSEIEKLTKAFEQHIYSFRSTPAPHHLMVDSHSVGERNWEKFQSTIVQFLEKE